MEQVKCVSSFVDMLFVEVTILEQSTLRLCLKVR